MNANRVSAEGPVPQVQTVPIGPQGGRCARLTSLAPEMAELLEAIIARIDGEWDNRALVKWGALHHSADADIERHVNALLARINGNNPP